MRRRDGSAETTPPVELLRYRESEWAGVAEWDAARQEWARRAPSLDVMNRLYGPDFEPPPEVDPRIMRG